MSAAVSRYYLHTYREIENWLSKTVYPSGRPKPFKKVTFSFTEEQLQMATKRGVKTNAKPVSQNQPANNFSRNAIKWINVRIDSDDAAFLAESTAGFSELAAMACEYVARGYSLTVKPMDGGDSVMACLTGQSSTHPDVTCGVSGFASNVRDALLVLCYKFEDKLAGQLPLPDGEVDTQRARFR